MTAITMKYFDVFNFVKKAKEFGVNEQFAEYEARQIEQAISTIAHDVKAEIKQELHSDELVTRADLKQQLEIVKLELQKEIEISRSESKSDIKSLEIKLLTIYGGGFLVLLGVLAKGFHWL